MSNALAPLAPSAIALPRWTRETFAYMPARQYDVIDADADTGLRFRVWDAMGLNVNVVEIERDVWGPINEVGEPKMVGYAHTWEGAEDLIRKAIVDY